MTPTLILDTSVLVAGLRSWLGASYPLLGLIGSGRFTVGLTAALVLEYEAGARGRSYLYSQTAGKGLVGARGSKNSTQPRPGLGSGFNGLNLRDDTWANVLAEDRPLALGAWKMSRGRG